ncbi:MAG: gliding motility-associated C-terminal domain-containing protein [Bacteroidota bacterium]
MSTHRRYLLILSLFFFVGKWLSAQAEFHLRVQPDGKTYTAFVKPQSDWLPPLNNLVYGGRVAIVVPANGLAVSNLQNHLGQWQLTGEIEQPPENAGADYFIFEMIGSVADSVFLSGVEMPLFSFENGRSCAGAFALVDVSSDPFALYSPLGAAVRQSFLVEGAGGEAYAGNYDLGQADCMAYLDCGLFYEIKLLPNGFYQVNLSAGNNLPVPSAVRSLKVGLKVPTNFFQMHGLANLQSNDLAFSGVMRFDAPLEEPGFDYIAINMAGIGGQPMLLTAGETIPLLQFGNGGSCQGDSIFLVENLGDPFFPPNSQNAIVVQQVQMENAAFPQPVCILGDGAVPCLGCLFTADVLSLNEVVTVGPVLCLGQTDGSIELIAEGADSLIYSIDAGQNWQSSPFFNNLTIGTYQPVVLGQYYGCPVVVAAPPVVLEERTQIDLQLEVPPKACEGDDLAMQVLSPLNMPLSTDYSWSGPLGFSAAIADPVLFNINAFQTGTYSLTVNVPGCDAATATAELEVVRPADVPTLISNAPVCDGEPLILTTDVAGEKYEWIGPAGQSAVTLALPGLTTQNDTTILPKGHPAYLAGDWKIRLTDSNGCTVESAANELTIKERPVALAANDGPVCLGKDAQLSAVPLAGAIYQWRIAGDSSIFSFDPQPVLSNVTSEIKFELSVELEGCESENRAVTTVALHPKPSAFPVFDYQLAADCSPEDILLTANASGIGLTYEWTGTNGFISQIENPTISNANAMSNGSYQLKVTNIHGCTAVNPFEITGVVDAVATPNIQSTGDVCPGEDLVLSVIPYTNAQVSYSWFKNGSQINGATSSQLNLDAMQANDAGLYHLEVQVDACTVESADLLVEVLPLPEVSPDFILTFPCEGATLQFLSNSNSIAGWAWTGPNGFNSTAQSPVIYNTEFDDVGTYSLTVTGDNGCTASESVIVDGILPVPDAPHVATNSPVCPEDELVLVVQNPTLLGTVFYEWVNGLGDPVGNGSEMLELATDDPMAIPPFLVKKNVNGCESELSDPIPVEIKPMPVADAENSGSVCPGDQVQLFAAPVDNATYAWRQIGNPQIVSFEQNPQLSLMDTTEFELTVQTIGCDAEAADTTLVFTHPQPIIADLIGGGSYCEGTVVELSGSVGGNISGEVRYTWTGPNGFLFTNMADASEPFVVNLGVLQAQGEGAYTLQLESSTGCLSSAQSVVVDFIEMPDPPVVSVTSNLLCEGEHLQLDATGYPGNNVLYKWYFDDGNGEVLLASTSVPTYFINDLTPVQSGNYYAVANVDGCEPPASNLQQVTVLGIGSNVTADNSTTVDEPVCEGGDVFLEATWIPGATYHWFGPAGFEETGNSPVLTDAGLNAAGSYLVEINHPSCTNLLTTSTTVFVKPKPAPPVLAGAAEVCVGFDAVVEVLNDEPNAVYQFYFTQNNVLIETGTTPMFTLSQIVAGQSGSYYAVVDVDGCQSDASQWFDLQVVSTEIVEAFAGDEQIVCDENELVSLLANEPSIGTGLWSSLNSATIVQPNEPGTSIDDLVPGENLFVWSIDQPVCNYFSADTTSVFYEKITAQPDMATLGLTDTVAFVDLLANDAIAANGWDIQVAELPKKGELKIDADGMAVYRPYPNVFGEDEFKYEICSMTCPDVCHSATVQLLIESTNTDASDCFVPNLISPNNDGENDVFVVPCAAVFEGSELVVFNRYGTTVYQNPNYQNDWGGTYDGEQLPVGTYFYQLSLNDEGRTVLSGYVAVIR